MQWISLKDRLPEKDGQKVLLWEIYDSEEEGRRVGDIELVTFKLTRYEWDHTIEYGHPEYPRRLEFEDPSFQWAGGDNDCEWRQSTGFFHQGGYGYTDEGEEEAGISKRWRATHWMPIPDPPRF